MLTEVSSSKREAVFNSNEEEKALFGTSIVKYVNAHLVSWLCEYLTCQEPGRWVWPSRQNARACKHSITIPDPSRLDRWKCSNCEKEGDLIDIYRLWQGGSVGAAISDIVAILEHDLLPPPYSFQALSNCPPSVPKGDPANYALRRYNNSLYAEPFFRTIGSREVRPGVFEANCTCKGEPRIFHVSTIGNTRPYSIATALKGVSGYWCFDCWKERDLTAFAARYFNTDETAALNMLENMIIHPLPRPGAVNE